LFPRGISKREEATEGSIEGRRITSKRGLLRNRGRRKDMWISKQEESLLARNNTRRKGRS
jgi:hypothetical protein